MKDTIKKFLRINKIVSLVLMIVCAVWFVINIILDIINASFVDIYLDIIRTAAPIAAFIIAPIAEKKLLEVKEKKDATPGAVLAIVSGALGGIFGIPAGIMAFCLEENQYPIGDVVAQPVDENK